MNVPEEREGAEERGAGEGILHFQTWGKKSEMAFPKFLKMANLGGGIRWIKGNFFSFILYNSKSSRNMGNFCSVFFKESNTHTHTHTYTFLYLPNH